MQDEWQSGSDSGTFDDAYGDFSWAMETNDWTEAGVEEVTMTVSWQHRGHEKFLTLTTLMDDSE